MRRAHEPPAARSPPGRAWTLCAIDALGLPAMADRDGRITSADPEDLPVVDLADAVEGESEVDRAGGGGLQHLEPVVADRQRHAGGGPGLEHRLRAPQAMSASGIIPYPVPCASNDGPQWAARDLHAQVQHRRAGISGPARGRGLAHCPIIVPTTAIPVPGFPG